MTSTDTYLIIGGQTLRVEDGVIRPFVSMDTNSVVMQRLDSLAQGQTAILRRLDAVEAEQKKIRAEIVQLGKDQTGLIHDVNMTGHTMYWVLGAIGIFIAGLAIPAFVLSMIGLMNNSTKSASKKHTDTAEFEETARRVFREMMPELRHKEF